MIILPPPLILPPEKPAFVQPAREIALPRKFKRFLIKKGIFPTPYILRRRVTTIEFGSGSVLNPSATTHTHSGMTLGAADSGRYVIAAIDCRNASAVTVSSLTIAGITATLIYAYQSGGTISGFWVALAPTGTTGDVVITFSGSTSRSGVSTYRLLTSYDPTSYSDAQQDTTATSNHLDITLNVPAMGVALAAFFYSNSTTATTSWSGLAEDYDNAYPTAANQCHSTAGGTNTFPTGNGSLAVQAQGSGTAGSVLALTGITLR